MAAINFLQHFFFYTNGRLAKSVASLTRYPFVGLSAVDLPVALRLQRAELAENGVQVNVLRVLEVRHGEAVAVDAWCVDIQGPQRPR